MSTTLDSQSRPEAKATGKGRGKSLASPRSNFGIKASIKYRRWMRKFLRHVGEEQISTAFRHGMRLYAESSGFEPPPRR